MATVLFICAVGGHGGPIASLRDILPGLASHRRVCMGPFSEFTLPHLEPLCDSILDMTRPRGLGGVARAVMQVRRAIRRERPDVIFANGLTEVAVTALALTALGELGSTPVVVWVHNYETPALTEPTAAFVRRKDFRFYAVSELAADLAKHAGLTDQVTLIPNPLADGIVAEPIPGEGRVRVSYLGTDRHYKGFDWVAPVIERLRDLPITWRLHLPNTGRPVWQEMDRLLADPELDIRVLGRVQPVSKAYAEADVVFIPSRQESFCRVASEAMANGVPVVASALSPLRGLLGNDEAGRLVSPGDLDGYADAIRALVRSEALRKKLGDTGRERAASYEVDGVIEQWRNAIEDAAHS